MHRLLTQGGTAKGRNGYFFLNAIEIEPWLGGQLQITFRGTRGATNAFARISHAEAQELAEILLDYTGA